MSKFAITLSKIVTGRMSSKTCYTKLNLEQDMTKTDVRQTTL